MKSTLFSLFILLFLQACQVNENTLSTGNLSISNFPVSDFQVVLPNDGWKKLGTTISIELIHSQNLMVTGQPYIKVNLGKNKENGEFNEAGVIRNFLYVSGSGSKKIVFSYTVSTNDEDRDGIKIKDSIELNGGSITYLDNNNEYTNTKTNLNFFPYEIKVDGIIPTLESVRAPQTGNYVTGSLLNYSFRYSENVFVKGIPKFNLGLPSGTGYAEYNAGSGTKVLNYRYQVKVTDIDNDGFTTSPLLNLNSAANITISDEAGNTVSNTIPSISSDTLFLDYRLIHTEELSNFTSISPSILTGLGITQPVDFTIRFPETMTLAQNSYIQLPRTAGTFNPTYLSGSSTQEIKFRYTVQQNLESFSGLNFSVPTLIKSPSTLFINSSVPSVMSAIIPSNQTYGLNQILEFKIKFDADVNVTGIPVINLNLTTGPVKAKYVSGSGSDELVFHYTVETEKQDLDGISAENKIELNGGTIKDSTNTFNAILTLPSMTTSSILVDSVSGPSVLFAYAPAPKIYKTGENLDFTLIFNRPVTVTCQTPVTVCPRIPLNLGGVTPTTVYANYESSLSAGNTVVFRYTVQSGDNDLDGLTSTQPIDLNGMGSILDAQTLSASLYFPFPAMTGIFVDGLAPSIVTLTAPPSGTYGAGQILTFIASYNEVVNVEGTPKININLTSGPVTANYSSGSGTNILNFTYEVQAGDLSNGITLVSPLDIVSVGGTTIKDLREYAQSPLTFTLPTTTGIIIDGSAPSITAMSVSPNPSTRILGQTITFSTTWSEAVITSGNPRIALDIGGVTAYANLSSCSSSTACTFVYAVAPGHQDINGISFSSTSFDTSLGNIKDLSGNTANLNFSSVAPIMTSLNIDGVAPTISSVTVSTSNNRTYIIGEDIEFTVTWSEPVTIFGSSYLSFVMGSETVNAVGISGSGTTTHVYRYTVQTGDFDNNGITLHTTIYPSGGSVLQDANQNAAALSFTPPLTNLTLVDGIIPTIGLVTPPAMNNYHLNETVNFTFNWSEPVTVNGGIPSIAIYLSDMQPPSPFPAIYRYATYNPSLSTSTKMVFSYTVQTGDLDTDGVQLAPIGSPLIYLNGSTIEDLAGNPITTSISYISPDLSGVYVDGVRPFIQSLTAPSSGRYGAGTDVNFKIKFSSNVLVSGPPTDIPKVKIGFGSSYVWADYSAGSGTDELTFTYTVLLNNNGNNLGTTIYSDIVLNGGTIQDGAGNNAYLNFTNTLYPGVIIDGVLPLVSTSTTQNTTVTTNHGTFKPGQVMSYILTFDEIVTVTGTPRIKLNIDGNTRYATYSSNSGAVVTFNYSVDAANALLDLDGVETDSSMDLATGSIQDLAGNNFAGTFSFTEKDYIHYTGMVGRYNVSSNNYTVATCNGTSVCAKQVKDLTGVNHLNYFGGTTIGPVLKTSGFGANNTGYLQFEQNTNTYSNRALKFTTQNTIKYLFAVVKTPPDPSNTPSVVKDHVLLRRYNSSPAAWKNTIFFSSSGTSGLQNRYLFYDYQTSPTYKGVKSRWNDYPWDATFASMKNFTWIENTYAIYSYEYENPQVYPANNTILGGYKNTSGTGGFNGQMAEFIYMTADSNLDALKIEKIISQLNAIHGVY